jgi:hypothetical protein
MTTKVAKFKKFNVLKCFMFSLEIGNPLWRPRRDRFIKFLIQHFVNKFLIKFFYVSAVNENPGSGLDPNRYWGQKCWIRIRIK